MGRSTTLAALTTMAFLATTGSALAADAAVSVGNDKRLAPTGVSVNRGDDVTWTWVGPDTDHSILSDAGQAESWDSDPVALGPTRGVGGTFAHTFSQLGTFSYHCRVHPEMQGMVTVSNANPVASFTGPERITAGNAARFDAGGSSDVDGAIVSYEWDLDGDGIFETLTGTSSDVSRSYPDVGARLISVRVTDSDGAADSKSQFLSVDPPPPPVPAGPAPAPVAPAAATQTAGSGSAGSTRLTVTGATRQRAVKARGVKVTVACPGRCSLSARGTIAIKGSRSVRLANATRTLTSAGRANLTLKIARRDLGRLRRALAGRKRAVATVTVTARAGGTTKTGKRKITLVR